MQLPVLPETAPFTPEQRSWLNGYLAGLFHDRITPAPTPVASSNSNSSIDPGPGSNRGTLRIGYGSQTGSAAGVARRLAKEAKERGYQVTLEELNQIELSTLAAAPTLFCLITSTWGDGDPPENAEGFWRALSAESAPRLETLRHAVLGLGDRNYSEFCGAARQMDQRLTALGAQALMPMGECDVDYESSAKDWVTRLWLTLEQTGDPTASVSATDTDFPVEESAALGTRRNPWITRLRINRRLNGDGSERDTRHFEIDHTDAPFQYVTGDALGIRPKNSPILVDDLLKALRLDGSTSVSTSSPGNMPLGQALEEVYHLGTPSKELLKEIAGRTGNNDLTHLLSGDLAKELQSWLWGRDVLDVVQLKPLDWDAQTFVNLLRPLTPRLYSIASSPCAHPDSVHLTVGIVRYAAHGRDRTGLCSGWLADRVEPGKTEVPAFLHSNPRFRLPQDTSTPIIMVGPGTGIAPFRAFLQERRATGGGGRNWLFFGNPYRATDFLYENELQSWHTDGHLSRLDLAFSRDQSEKLYVQHRMLEHQTDIWRWLDEGAHFYVCGDASRMARDVQGALHTIAMNAGGLTADNAEDFLERLKKDNRYQRDVY